ncbi:MAG: hypothetical protein AB7C89_03825 [Intestinibacillus sp.]
MEQEKQMQIFGCMADVLKENGYRAEVVRSDDPAHPTLLRIETTRNGKIMQEVMVEMCFIPISMPGEDVALLQYYATLFSGLPKETARETKKACEYCNDYCALGAFGYFAPAGQLYLKHNTLLRVSDDLEKVVTFMADNLSLVLASIQRFIDALATVANGVMDVEAAVEQELLPKM